MRKYLLPLFFLILSISIVSAVDLPDKLIFYDSMRSETLNRTIWQGEGFQYQGEGWMNYGGGYIKTNLFALGLDTDNYFKISFTAGDVSNGGYCAYILQDIEPQTRSTPCSGSDPFGYNVTYGNCYGLSRMGFLTTDSSNYQSIMPNEGVVVNNNDGWMGQYDYIYNASGYYILYNGAVRLHTDNLPTPNRMDWFAVGGTSDGYLAPALIREVSAWQIDRVCDPVWVQQNSTCSNYQQYTTYTDSNNCGANENLPENNGTFVECGKRVALHSNSDVSSVVIDFIVEYGLQAVKIAGLIAIVVLGVWAIKRLIP